MYQINKPKMVRFLKFKFLNIIKLSRGEICVANFSPPWHYCSFGQLFWQNRGVCQLAKNEPIQKFYKIYCTKCKW